MRENPKPFELYRHFKGNLYQILTLAKDSETLEDVVVYQALYGDYAVYVRTLAMFMSEVDKEKFPDVAEVYRFEKEGGQGMVAKGKKEEKSVISEHKIQSEEIVSKLQNEDRNKNIISENRQQAMENEEPGIDPVVLEFLDAETYEEKLRILVQFRETITDEMITTMAIATDVEVEEGPKNERYEQLKNCLMTLKKYECDRLR